MWNKFKAVASSLGPGLITAALVLGPGSVTVVSKAGATHGTRLIWVALGAGVLMAGFTAMAARIGVVADVSLLQLVRREYGRWLAALMGICSFIICCCFQAGDNLGVSIALHAILEDSFPGADKLLVIRLASAGFTALSIGILLSAPNLYRAVERIMTALVVVMIVCFFANLVPARPSLRGIAGGLVPRIGEAPLSLVTPMVATTFSVIAAMYQAYMVQNKGWTLKDYRRGVVDSLVGIAVLTLLSIVIMVTAATVLHPRGIAVNTAGDMARELEPLLGRTAKHFFAVGLWGASFSSLVANAIVGGGLLADGLGLGSRFENRNVKICTVAVMLVGALVTHFGAAQQLRLIVVAQALTIPFVPLCAFMMILVANRRSLMGVHVNGWKMNLLALAGLATVAGLGAWQLGRLL